MRQRWKTRKQNSSSDWSWCCWNKIKNDFHSVFRQSCNREFWQEIDRAVHSLGMSENSINLIGCHGHLTAVSLTRTSPTTFSAMWMAHHAMCKYNLFGVPKTVPLFRHFASESKLNNEDLRRTALDNLRKFYSSPERLPICNISMWGIVRLSVVEQTTRACKRRMQWKY